MLSKLKKLKYPIIGAIGGLLVAFALAFTAVAFAQPCTGVYVGGTDICYPNFPAAGSILFGGGTGALATSTGLYYSTANQSLGLNGTTTPYGTLSINANGGSAPSFVIGSTTSTSFSVNPTVSGGDIVDIATSTTGANVWGITNGGQVYNTGSIPSVATSSGSGTGSVPVTLQGTANDINFNIVTGTSPTAAATIATFTMPNSCPTATVPVLSPGNLKSQALAVGAVVFASSTASNTFVIVAGATALSAATNYKWNIHVGCY